MIYILEVNRLLETVQKKSLVNDWSKRHQERQRRRYFHKVGILSLLLPNKPSDQLIETLVRVLNLNLPLKSANFSVDYISESNV